MIYGFMRQSGGEIRVYSEVGRGTTLCLYLPRHYGEPEKLEQTVEKRFLESPGSGETILVVDDEPSVRTLVVEVLEELGYLAIEAGDGPTALRLLQSVSRVDLLITDLTLPGGIDGREVADRARILKPSLSVLCITGYAENAVIGTGQLQPGVQLLHKPFSMQVLASPRREYAADALKIEGETRIGRAGTIAIDADTPVRSGLCSVSAKPTNAAPKLRGWRVAGFGASRSFPCVSAEFA